MSVSPLLDSMRRAAELRKAALPTAAELRDRPRPEPKPEGVRATATAHRPDINFHGVPVTVELTGYEGDPKDLQRAAHDAAVWASRELKNGADRQQVLRDIRSVVHFTAGVRRKKHEKSGIYLGSVRIVSVG